jgi:Pyruvate/2-oxoacid:ferredoxin oxidoreductase delta subunit
MALRKIVKIDEQKCNGCGECIPGCPEGALRIVEGKARLVRDEYCDGLGACLGKCPQNAITIVEREAADFDEQAVAAHQLHDHRRSAKAHSRGPGAPGCPGAAVMDMGTEPATPAPSSDAEPTSALTQWPVQLHLVPVRAPFFDGADLLLAADCTPFALADFHGRLLRGRRILVACPKLDDTETYEQKLAAMLRENDIKALTVVHMEVPCCRGLVTLALKAVRLSGKDVPLKEITVTLRGRIQGPQKVHHHLAPEGVGGGMQ